MTPEAIPAVARARLASGELSDAGGAGGDGGVSAPGGIGGPDRIGGPGGVGESDEESSMDSVIEWGLLRVGSGAAGGPAT